MCRSVEGGALREGASAFYPCSLGGSLVALHLSQTVPSLNIAYTQEKGYVTADIAEKEKLTKLNLSGK